MLDSKSVVQAGQFLAHPLHLIALGLGQVQAGPAIIAHRFRQQLGVLALELRLRVGISLDRLVNVLAIIKADRPLFQFLDRVGGGIAQSGVGAGFLDQPETVVGEADLKRQIVQGADGVVEGDFGGFSAPMRSSAAFPTAIVFVSVSATSLVVVSNCGTLRMDLYEPARVWSCSSRSAGATPAEGFVVTLLQPVSKFTRPSRPTTKRIVQRICAAG